MAQNTFTTSGILLVDKPAGITSHDVVARTRKLAGTRKIGHAGTLDPMATGLLVLGVNSSTRLLTFVVGLGKEYVTTIRLGQSTDTDDAEGAVTDTTPTDGIDEAAVRAALDTFVGEISQVPSSVSAIRVDGKRAYELARAGETVELKARAVTISAIEVTDVRRVSTGSPSTGSGTGDFIDIDCRIECSSGTYIRAIARDLGALLGVGGHLTALRRTKIGPFNVTDAATLDETLVVVDRLIPPATIATELFPVRSLDAQEVIDLVHGKRISAAPLEAHEGPIAAIAPSGVLAGIVEVRGDRLRPIVNFPTSEVTA
jgi:tRNA pseudouridine55 synthase